MTADPVLCQVADLMAGLASATPPTVLDVRWRLAGPPARAEHEAGHIPGSVFVDLDEALAAPVRPDRVGGRHPLPDRETFGVAMRRAGVRSGTAVVVVDDGDGVAASRAWWLLRHHGHQDVRILEGGWAAWLDGGGTVTAVPTRPVPGDWQPSAGRLPTVDAGGAATVAEAGLLLDARTEVRFRGDAEPVDPVAGRVPGAVSTPAALFVSAEGRWTDPARLRGLLGERGYREGDPLATYCGSGVTAAVVVAALERAGVQAALYPGSWSDWISDPDRPVATG